VRRQSRHTLSFGIASDASAVDSGPVAYEFKLPDLGEGLTEGEIARWLVTEGQEIGEDGRRIGLRVLLAPAGAWIQEPRA